MQVFCSRQWRWALTMIVGTECQKPSLQKKKFQKIHKSCKSHLPNSRFFLFFLFFFQIRVITETAISTIIGRARWARRHHRRRRRRLVCPRHHHRLVCRRLRPPRLVATVAWPPHRRRHRLSALPSGHHRRRRCLVGPSNRPAVRRCPRISWAIRRATQIVCRCTSNHRPTASSNSSGRCTRTSTTTTTITTTSKTTNRTTATRTTRAWPTSSVCRRPPIRHRHLRRPGRRLRHGRLSHRPQPLQLSHLRLLRRHRRSTGHRRRSTPSTCRRHRPWHPSSRPSSTSTADPLPQTILWFHRDNYYNCSRSTKLLRKFYFKSLTLINSIRNWLRKHFHIIYIPPSTKII